ncbi:hypothetical protein MY3296_001651 [Beauveria thailandica]
MTILRRLHNVVGTKTDVETEDPNVCILWICVPFYIFGLGLMIHFRQPGGYIGYIVMCQVFISAAGSVFIICCQLAVLSVMDHQHVASASSLLFSMGGIGAPTKDLPASDLPNLLTIYSTYTAQLAYPWGSPTRDAIVKSYGYAQTRLLAAGTVFMVLGFIWVGMIKNINKIHQIATVSVSAVTHTCEMDGAFDTATIPGIGRALREKDLIMGSTTYNGLIPIERQVELQGSHADDIKALLAIIDKYGMGGLFGVHSLHRHDAVPDKTIRLESGAPGIDGMSWTRATAITSDLLAPDKIHANFFKVQGSAIIPFEFSKDLIAIEVKDFTKKSNGDDRRTSELDIVWGTAETLTLILPFNRMIEKVTNPVPTGWSMQYCNPEADPSQPGPGEHWNQATKSNGSVTHKVHVDSAEPISAELLYASLVEQGYVAKI